MASPLNEQHRWSAHPDQFAATVQVDDVPGFFSRQLVIEPGTRALIVDQGAFLGEIPPGTYSLETFDERLQFWLRRQATAILIRQEDFALTIEHRHVPTAEHLTVDVTMRLVVQIDDVAQFWTNLMGTRRSFSAEDLREAISPLVQQALWESVGRMSITDITSANARQEFDAQIAKVLTTSMKRYGLRFVQVQTVGIRHEKFDEHRKKLGETWLLKEGLEQTKALDEIYSEEELLRIKKLERDNDLAVLADNVAVDRTEADVSTKKRRIEIRSQLRDAIQSDEFDKITNEEELARFIEQRDKDRLLRREEIEQLQQAYRERKEDRESARNHIVAMLDLERKLEIDSVREQLDHALRTKRLDHEIQLAQQVRSKDNEAWEASLIRERQKADHQREQRDKELAQRREWVRQEAGHRREQEWDDLAHQQRGERLQAEIEVTRQEHINRVTLLETELKRGLDTEQLESEKRRKEWDLEVAQKESHGQLDRMAALQRLNHQAAQREVDLYERRKRLDLELQDLQDDKFHTRQLARFQAIATLSAEAMVAVADGENAALLADLKKHEATQQAAVAQAEIAARSQLDEQRVVMYEKLSEAEKSKADAIADTFREAMQGQQQNVQQMVASLGAMGQEQARAQQPTVVVPPVVPGMAPSVLVVGPATNKPAQETPNGPSGPVAPTPDQPLAETRPPGTCPSCHAEIPAGAKFCSGCGTKLA